jgi:hypothetical protein
MKPFLRFYPIRRCSRNVKQLKRHISYTMTAGYVPPGILSYVVAYKGSAKISTIYEWLKRIEKKHNLNAQDLPVTGDQRNGVLSESLEGIFCLGSGRIVFDNSPIGVVTDQARQETPQAKYSVFDSSSGNVMHLFILLTLAVSGVSLQTPDLVPYLRRVQLHAKFVP